MGGTVVGATADLAATGIAWAADRVLAVGPDEVVRTISRGDSTFLDLGGCAVTAAPRDPRRAERLLQSAVVGGRPFDALALLAEAGLLDAPTALEPGSPADLAFWSTDPAAPRADSAAPPADAAASLRIVALVQAGAFTEGDEHCGPFSRIV